MGRKARDAAKRKLPQSQPRALADVPLAPELLAEWGGGVDDAHGPLVLAGTRAPKPQERAAAPGLAKVPLTKAQRKKLAKIEEVRRARDVRAEVLASLSTHALSAAQQALLRPTSALGQRETMREGLSRALKHERMGLPVPAEIPLLRERREAPEAEEAEADEEEAAEAEARPAAAPPPAPAAGGDALAALAARALGTRARKPDRQSLKRHKTAAAEAEEAEDAPARPLAAAAPAAAALRPLARALRADVTGEAEGVADDPHAAERAARRAAMAQRPPDEPRKRVVHPPRPADVAEARLKLPILAMEQEIMEAIEAHDVVVLCGETGCGKTTQLPQFLYEAGFGTLRPGGGVVVTQPRRVAVTATAARVAAELGEPRLGANVGYAVRHDGAVGPNAPLRFVTDGVLLREAQNDLLLSRYGAIVVDEAHERSVNTDLLVGLLSRVVPLRARMAAAGSGPGPLKLVVMSATLRVDDFAANERLCASPPPVLRVPARQFPVTVHFARRTPGADYVDAAFRKVCAIHRKLPPGGVLVFLTGQREVEHLAQRLRRTFNRGAEASNPGAAPGATDDVADALGADAFDRDALDAAAEAAEAELDAQFPEAPGDDDDDDASGSEESDEEETVMLGGDALEEDAAAAAAADAAAAAAAAAARAAAPDAGPGPMHVLPLYALLPAAAQARVFAPPPPGSRLVVVATNVAETSLTIPGIRYVVDAGRAKSRIFEPGAAGAGGGLSRFAVGFVSQASAAQRAGRAGRTGPGHAYRLYSSAHYTHQMPEHAPPELQCVPLEAVVLQMKSMGVDRVAGFPFPSPPDGEALTEAEAALTRLGALGAGGALSALGRGMALLPVAPRAGRMLLAVAAEPRAAALLPHAAAIAAALSLESPFLKGGGGTASIEGAEADADADGDAPKPPATAATPAPPALSAAEAERVAWEARGRGRHAKYSHPRSDALSAVAALLAFEAASIEAGGGAAGAAAAETLCTADALHARTLREMSDLRAQLARLLARHAPALCAAAAEAAVEAAAEAGGAATAPVPDRADAAARVAAALGGGPPPAATLPGGAERALRRALAAGWADRVARRVKPLEQLSGAPSRAVRYRAALAAGSGHVFLHPSSALARSAPEWVVYTELLATGVRPYMLGATEIDPAWLPAAAPRLVALSAPLAEPAPRYVGGAADAVVAWRDATYGPQMWPLPRVAAPLPASADGAVGAFAAALLAGDVSAAMAPLVPRLAAPPATAARPEARSQRRVGELLHALQRRGIASRAALKAAWRAEPRFLLPELCAWMRAGQQHALERAWPDIVACALPAEEADEAERKHKRKKRAAAEDAL